MYRIDNSTAVLALPAPTAPGPKPNGYFTDGDPQAAIPATIVDAEWANMVQEEVSNVIVGAGIALDKADRTQLRTAIQQMIAAGSHSVIIKNAVFEASVADGEAVKWDAANNRFDEAVADGTANNRAVGLADVTNSEVVAFGETRAGLVAGLTPGSRYYLDAAVPGALVEAAPNDRVSLGIAKAATVFFVDIDYLGAPPLLQGRRAAWIDASVLIPTVTAGGGGIGSTETQAGRPDVIGVDFDFAADQNYQFGFAFPKSWDKGTVTFKFHVMEAEAGATQHAAVLAIQGVAIGSGETIDVAYGAAQQVTVNLGAVNTRYVSAETAAVTIAGPPQDGDSVEFRVTRKAASDAADTLDKPLRLRGIEIFYNLTAGNDA